MTSGVGPEEYEEARPDGPLSGGEWAALVLVLVVLAVGMASWVGIVPWEVLG